MVFGPVAQIRFVPRDIKIVKASLVVIFELEVVKIGRTVCLIDGFLDDCTANVEGVMELNE